jgi:hypothetical protein
MAFDKVNRAMLWQIVARRGYEKQPRNMFKGNAYPEYNATCSRPNYNSGEWR